MQATADMLTMQPMTSVEDAEAFRVLNEEWIAKLFTLEAKDRRTLNDPAGEIVARGGHVFVARRGDERVGCVALLAYGDGEYELSKMAVTPALRGSGIGRQLLSYTLDRARQIGARRVFLGSSTRLQNAVHLYESIGFRHVSPMELPPMGYARADVYMAYELPESESCTA